MNAPDHKARFKSHWVFLLLSLLALFLALYTYGYVYGEFRVLALVMSSTILAAGILKIIFSRANREHYRRAGWHMTGGIINIVLSVAFFYYYFLFNDNDPLINKLFLAFVGLWLLMHSFLNFAFAKEMTDVYIRAALPLLVMAVVGSFASIAVILLAFAEHRYALAVIIATLIVISVYNFWIYFYMKKNPVRN